MIYIDLHVPSSFDIYFWYNFWWNSGNIEIYDTTNINQHYTHRSIRGAWASMRPGMRQPLWCSTARPPSVAVSMGHTARIRPSRMTTQCLGLGMAWGMEMDLGWHWMNQDESKWIKMNQGRKSQHKKRSMDHNPSISLTGPQENREKSPQAGTGHGTKWKAAGTPHPTRDRRPVPSHHLAAAAHASSAPVKALTRNPLSGSTANGRPTSVNPKGFSAASNRCCFLHPMFGSVKSVKVHVSKATTLASLENNAAVDGRPVSASKLEALFVADKAPASFRPALQTTRQDGMDIRWIIIRICFNPESSWIIIFNVKVGKAYPRSLVQYCH